MSKLIEQINTEKKSYRLSDFAVINPKVTLKKDIEYPFLDMAEVEPLQRIPALENTKIFKGSGSRFESGDTLFARITPCLENGKITQVLNTKGSAFGSTEFIVLRGKTGVSDSSYVYYLTQTDNVRKKAEQSMIGASGRQRVERTAFEKIEVCAPTLQTQKKVSQILSAYDSKIENNNKIIRNIEATARAIFKEWFIDFKFPGHEKTKMIESEIGEIPHNWEIKTLNEVSEIVFGFNFKSNLFNEENIGIPVVRIRDVLSGTTKTSTTEIPVDEYKIDVGDLLIGMDGTFHCGFWYTQGAYLNQRVARIRSSLPGYFIFESIRHQLDFLQKTITGATVGHLSNGDIRNFKILVPKNISMLDIFENGTRKILDLKKENISLESQRDQLLSRLI